jgi:hypothetical protein
MAVATISLYDTITDSADAPVANATVTLTFGYNSATTADGLLQPSQRTATTDSTGKFTFAKVIPNDLVSPANTIYMIETPFRVYEVAPQSTNGASQQSTAANVIVNNPLALAPYTLIGPVTISGTLTVVSSTGIQVNAAGDISGRSFTASASAPYASFPGLASGDTAIAGKDHAKFGDFGVDGVGAPLVFDNSTVLRVKGNPTYATTSNPIFYVSEDLGGTLTSGQAFINQIATNTDSVDASLIGGMTLLRVANAVTAGAKGGRTGLSGTVNQSGATTLTNTQYYVGLYGGATASASAGGLTGAGNQRGNLFGFNAWAQLQAGAGAFWNSVVGAEIDWSMQTGTGAPYKVGLQMVQTSDDAVAGSTLDAGITFTKQSGGTAVGWVTGISFGQQQGWWPAVSTATLIGTNASFAGGPAYAAAWGIDFNAVAFSSGFLRGPNGFTVDGSGNIKMASTLDVTTGGGSMFVGNTNAGAMTIGRSGQTVTFPGTVNVASTIDVSTGGGSMFIGNTNAGAIQVGRTGQPIGLYGVAAVARAAAIASPTAPSAGYVQAEAQSMKTAVDALRVAVQNIGITS